MAHNNVKRKIYLQSGFTPLQILQRRFYFFKLFFGNSKNVGNRTSIEFATGFTLIELLIVIAIIGILAAVLIPNLLSARAKAIDAQIKSNFKNIQTQAQLYYQDNETYAGGSLYSSVCGEPTIQTMRGEATNATSASDDSDNYDNPSTPFPRTIIVPTSLCYYSSTAYVVLAPLKSNTSQAMCVDSTGFAGIVAYDAVTDITCN